MNIFPLEIFPYGSLAASVTTTVWIGVCVVALFNLRFGWVLSGLVVPGYLVPLLIIRPVTAGVIIAESILTYAIVYWWSERMSARTGWWCSLFGRDRFFFLVVASIAVRLIFDSILLPVFGAWLVDEMGVAFDYRNSLRSFGLVIISLMANQYWKTGLPRGLFVLFVTVGITWVIVRFGLLEFTNFNIGNLRFMYEDIAGSIMASPKAYIVLLTAALIASRMNLLYGWDFNGILLPSLIALQWYQPSKVFTSFGEAILILIVGRYLIGTALFSKINMEGARLLLLFFNIGFVWKLLLGFSLPFLLPGVKVTDAYGFGYLLSTLLALKMHDKDIPARVTRATLQTSLTAVLLASVIGFLLTFMPEPWKKLATAKQPLATTQVSGAKPASLVDRIHTDRLILADSRRLERIDTPLPQESGAFSEGIEHVLAYTESRSPDDLLSARVALSNANYDIELVESRYVYIVERMPVRGWGLFVIDMENPEGLSIEVPRALDERHTQSTAIALFRALKAGSLAIAGSRFHENPDGSADVLENRQLPFMLFHRLVARNNSVQIRGLTGSLERKLNIADADGGLNASRKNSLWVTGSLPDGLNLGVLKGQLPELEIRWTAPRFRNVQRESSSNGFAELILSKSTRRRIAAAALIKTQKFETQKGTLRIDGYLREWLLDNRKQIAANGSNLYKPPTANELLYFDEDVLTPLIGAIRASSIGNDSTEIDIEEIESIDDAARAVGYRLVRYQHEKTAQDFIILQEVEGASRRYWGTYVFRLGRQRPYSIQVPRPLHEINSFEYAISLFDRLDASTLLIAGADPDTNTDGSADLVRLDNRQNMLSLVNQVLLRESGRRPYLVVHSRAFGRRADTSAPDADVVASFSRGIPTGKLATPLSLKLLDTLAADGLKIEFSGGSAATAGYDTGGLGQSRYLDATERKEFVALWLSPRTRSSYRQQSDNRQVTNRLAAIGISQESADLKSIAASLAIANPYSVPAEMQTALQRYLETDDIVTLHRIRNQWPDYDLRQITDRDSRQVFMTVTDAENRLAFIVNLAARAPEKRIVMSGDRISDINRFMNTRSGMLVSGISTREEPVLSVEGDSDR